MDLVAHKLTPACKGPSLINHRFSCCVFDIDERWFKQFVKNASTEKEAFWKPYNWANKS